MIGYLQHRWGAEGGYREFFGIAFPLVLSTASWSIQHFVDRVFLTWHSTQDLAAAMPAGMTNFTFVSLFLGIAGYINTFVAQYVGARRPRNVGPVVWQGAYLALLAALFGLALVALARPLFDLIGHDPAIREKEIVYFRILCYGFFPLVVSTSASCFFSGRGKTWTVLAVNIAYTSFNIVLDYGLIFGRWGLPAWGIRGAAWATNIATLFSALLFLGLMLQRGYREEFKTLQGWRFNFPLFRRLLRFGGPSGLTFMLDIMAFSLFILLTGRLGMVELAASNLAANINSLAFMPLIGCSIAVSTMVGQRLGQNRPHQAEYCTWTGFHFAFLYMTGMALAYVFTPELFLLPFDARAQGAAFTAARSTALVLLRIVAVYCVFDAMYIVFTAALKGAGDTRYVLCLSVGLSWALMVIPGFLALSYFDVGIYGLWSILCAYIVVAGIAFYLRFRAGQWKDMRVIEDHPSKSESEPWSIAPD